MANLKAVRFAAPKFMPVDGCAAFINDKAVVAANPAAADTLDFVVPAGLEISQLDIQVDDLDTGVALVFSVGYRALDSKSSLVASTTYFAPAGQTIAQTGGRLRCAFKPIVFNEDVIVQVVIGTAAAGFQAGEVWALIAGNTIGPK